MKMLRSTKVFLLLILLSLASCKDKAATEGVDTATTTETEIDNTATPETVPPTVDTIPGVESGAGSEQMP